MRIPHGRPHVQLDLAGIHLRKEVAPQERYQQEGERNEAEKHADEERVTLDRHRQQRVISGAQPLEARLETALEVHQRISRARRAIRAAMPEP